MVRVSAALKPTQVGAAFMGVDVVGEGEDLLVVGVVVLDGDLDLDPLLAAGKEDRLRMQRGFGAVEIFDERDDAAFVVKHVALVGRARRRF